MNVEKVIHVANLKVAEVKRLVEDIEGAKRVIGVLDVCDPLSGGRVTDQYRPKVTMFLTSLKLWKLKAFRLVRGSEFVEGELTIPSVAIEALVKILKGKLAEDVEKLNKLNKNTDI